MTSGAGFSIAAATVSVVRSRRRVPDLRLAEERDRVQALVVDPERLGLRVGERGPRLAEDEVVPLPECVAKAGTCRARPAEADFDERAHRPDARRRPEVEVEAARDRPRASCARPSRRPRSPRRGSTTSRTGRPSRSRRGETTAVTRTCPPILSAASVPGIRNEPGNSPTETTSAASGSFRHVLLELLEPLLEGWREVGLLLVLDDREAVEAHLRERPRGPGCARRARGSSLPASRSARPASRSAPSARRISASAFRCASRRVGFGDFFEGDSSEEIFFEGVFFGRSSAPREACAGGSCAFLLRASFS